MSSPASPIRIGALVALLSVFASVTAADAAPPSNDDFADAFTLIEGVEQRADNTDATAEVAESYCDAPPSVWWKFTAGVTGEYVAYATGSNVDTEIGLNTSVGVAVGTCPDDSAESYDAVDTWAMSAGDTIHVQMGVNSDTDRGTVGVGMALIEPISDSFAGRGSLEMRPGARTAVAGFGFAGTEGVQGGEPVTCGTTTFTATGWYEFTPPTSGAWMIEVKANDDLPFAVYSGSTLGSLNGRNCTSGTRKALAFDLVAGTSYAIQIQSDPSVTAVNKGVLRAEPANDIRGMSQLIEANGSDQTIGDSSAAVLLDSGELALAYTVDDRDDTPSDSIVFATRSSNGTWSRETVASFVFGGRTSVRAGVLANGDPIVVYNQSTTTDLYAAVRSSGVWTATTLATGVDDENALHVDGDGTVRVAYSNGSDVRLATRSPSGTWTDELVGTSVTPGPVDVTTHNGTVVVAHADHGTNQMIVSFRATSGWTHTVVRGVESLTGGASYLGADGWPSLGVSPDGTLTIAVQDSSLAHTYVGTWNGSTWTIERVLSDRLIAELGWGTAVRLMWDRDDRPTVFWLDDNYGGAVGVSVYRNGTWIEEIANERLGNPFTGPGSGDTFANSVAVIQLPDGRFGWATPDNASGDLSWSEDEYRVCPTAATPLTDVPATSFAVDDVPCIYGLDITTGTSATTYSPTDNVTREQMAAFLARLYRQLTGEACNTASHPFDDVPATSFATTDIGCIYDLGITKGTGDTTYSPYDDVTREQMAAFLARLYRATVDSSCSGGSTPFTDVPDTSFAKNDVPCIYGLHITTGTSATTYSPADSVTREQMAAFLARFWRTPAVLPT